MLMLRRSGPWTLDAWSMLDPPDVACRGIGRAWAKPQTALGPHGHSSRMVNGEINTTRTTSAHVSCLHKSNSMHHGMYRVHHRPSSPLAEQTCVRRLLPACWSAGREGGTGGWFGGRMRSVSLRPALSLAR